MKKNGVLVIAFAIFTMFFGAGNIILPLFLVKTEHIYWLSSFSGFLVSGVLVTFLGLLAASSVGNTKDFFKPLGVKLGFVIQLILIFIEGPLGVVPRSMIVAFGSVHSVLEDLPDIIFYALISFSIYYLTFSRKNVVELVGKYITPIMLSALLLVVAVTYYTNQDYNIKLNSWSTESFYSGISIGYLTYDLPGAIYFTAIAIGYLQRCGDSKSQRYTKGLIASALSILLLVIVYSVFVYLGLVNISIIDNVSPEMMLPKIVSQSLGNYFSYIFALFVVLACLTTAVAAMSIWVEFVKTQILFHYNVTSKTITIVSLFMAYFVSLQNFKGLMNILSPVLNLIYPILLLLTIYNIYITHFKKVRNS